MSNWSGAAEASTVVERTPGASIVEDVANKLADMAGQDLPIYQFLFPADVVNCIAIFPAGGGITGHIGIGPMRYAGSSGVPEAIDMPGFQVQVRYTDPFTAFQKCEAIRLWLDNNEPDGYLLSKTNRSQPDDLTSPEDLAMSGGPAYRFSCDFETMKVRT